MPWRNPFRKSSGAESSSSVVQFPVHIDLEDPRIRVTVYSHDLQTAAGTIGCWSYVTSGFSFWHQKEMVFTVKRDKDESPDTYPADPVHFFAAVGPLAREGRLVDIGDVTAIHSGHGPFGGQVFYIDAQPLPGVTLPDQTLAAIVITEDELITAREYGYTRVMARLGREAVYFPCPPWSDRARIRGVSRPPEQTILSGVLRVHVQALSVISDQQHIRILNTAAAKAVLQQLGEWSVDMPLALLTGIGPADSCLVWEPGLTGLNAIAAPGSEDSHPAGCFLMLVGEQDRNDLRLIEDGIALMLTTQDVTAMREALMGGQPLHLSTADGTAITVDGVAPPTVAPRCANESAALRSDVD